MQTITIDLNAPDSVKVVEGEHNADALSIKLSANLQGYPTYIIRRMDGYGKTSDSQRLYAVDNVITMPLTEDILRGVSLRLQVIGLDDNGAEISKSEIFKIPVAPSLRMDSDQKQKSQDLLSEMADALGQVTTAVDKADTAVNNANDAVQRAEAAVETANQAVQDVGNAASGANAAAAKAVTAAEAADTAAENAAAAAEQAIAEANNASMATADARNAIGEITNAITVAEQAIEEANTAAQNANVSAGLADDAANAAHGAAQTAETAAQNVGDAIDKADVAANNADLARTEAEKATAEANKAIEFINNGLVINLSEELKSVYTISKPKIREAIINKGVEVGEDVGLNDYADKIKEIPSAVNPTEDLPKQTKIVGYGLNETLGIKLVWVGVNASGYLVRRKLGGAPASTSDGDLVCDTTEFEFTDTNVTKGLEYYYRIFPYNAKRQYQAEVGQSIVKVDYKERLNQVMAGSLKVGDVVKFGRYKDSDYFWKVCDTLSIKDGYISLAAEQNLGALPFDAAENAAGNPNPITSRKSYGNNRYAFSNLRQLLNSDKEKGTWFVKQHEYDVAPSYATSLDGFLYEFTDYEKSVIYTRTKSCILDDLDGGGVETVEDKIWLPSTYGLGLEIRGGLEDDHVFNGFQTTEDRKYQSNYWCSTNNGSGSSVRYANSSGSLINVSAISSNCAARPFCSLPVGVFLLWSDSDNAYIFADEERGM